MVVNGKLKNTLDESGKEQYLAYDFKGNLLQKQRRVIKDALTASVIDLSVVFPVVGGLLAIGYAYADDKGYIDKWIHEAYRSFDMIYYETSKGIYDLEQGLSKGWRP